MVTRAPGAFGQRSQGCTGGIVGVPGFGLDPCGSAQDIPSSYDLSPAALFSLQAGDFTENKDKKT